jgi:hypothetical protein
MADQIVSVPITGYANVDVTQIAALVPAGAAGAPGAPGVSPSATSVAAALAATPSFVQAVATLLALPVPAPTPVPVTGSGPSGTVAYVYTAGKLQWGGDWSFSATPNYSDSTILAPDGTPSLRVTLTGQWGGWQPYINALCQANVAECFVTNPYKYLCFQLNPNVANQTLGGAILSANDTPDGVSQQNFGAYGSANPPINKWTWFKIPLSVYNLSNLTILKFSISDQTTLGAGHYFNLANVCFSSG